MRCAALVAAVAAVALSPAAGRSADDAELGDQLHLEQVVAYAREHNPEIQAARQRWRAAEARPSQAGSLPEPMVDLAYHNESFDGFTQGESQFSWIAVGASQEVPFPGKLGLKRDVAARAADQSEADYHRVENDVLGRAKAAYADYAHVFELIDIVRRNTDLLEKLARTAESRYAVGEGIQQDVVRAQLERSLLVDRETVLEQRRQSQAANLNALLGRPVSAPLGMAQHLEEKHLRRTLDEVIAAAQAHAPMLAAAVQRVAGSEAGVALAQREYFPDFVVRAAYYNKADLLPEWEVGVGIKVPLYFATKQRFGVDEASATLAEARAMREDTSRTVEARVKDLYAQASASERLIALYHTTVVPQARLALESALSAYQVGKADFLTLLNSYTVQLEYEMRYHEELANFQKAVAELDALVGEALEG
jgi:outer membrane protein, heavy metal efflux system